MKIIILTDTEDKELIIATKKFFRTVFQDVIVRPIPMKRESIAKWCKDNGINAIESHETSSYDQGWNDCVDYIETEEPENE